MGNCDNSKQLSLNFLFSSSFLSIRTSLASRKRSKHGNKSFFVVLKIRLSVSDKSPKQTNKSIPISIHRFRFPVSSYTHSLTNCVLCVREDYGISDEDCFWAPHICHCGNVYRYPILIHFFHR